jgi:RNA polymerase sigma-70 factor, ECF subfamily
MDIALETDRLLKTVEAGDGTAVGPLFELYRDRLWRMLAVRLDARVQPRVSADDVLQEAFLDISKRIGEYIRDQAVSFYVWLRYLTVQRMQMVHRAHLGAAARDAGREQGQRVYADADSMAGQFAGGFTTPSRAAMRAELQQQLRTALGAMDSMDREVLALRHFEDLSNAEAAAILEITPDAASKRHVRALKRLKEILTAAGGLTQ